MMQGGRVGVGGMGLHDFSFPLPEGVGFPSLSEPNEGCRKEKAPTMQILRQNLMMQPLPKEVLGKPLHLLLFPPLLA
jgi:hypothetical protein